MSLIPKRSELVEVLPFDQGEYLLQHKTLKHQVNINQQTLNLLDLVNGQRTVDEIAKAYHDKYGSELAGEDVYQVLYKKLGSFQVIENEEYTFEKREKPSYLKLSFTLLKAQWITPVVGFLAPLFAKRAFFITLLVSVGFTLAFSAFYLNEAIAYISSTSFGRNIVYILIAGCSMFLHEFGHAAAAKRYGATHGDIGFGFYLFTPVLYADVSDIWKLSKDKRLIVNLAGIYTDLLLASLCATIFLLTSSEGFLVIAYLVGFKSLVFNINPFFRTDGYWVLSDMTGITNLRNKSIGELKSVLSGQWPLGVRNVFLLVYGFISTTIIALFLLMLVVKDPIAILAFPGQFVGVVTSIFSGNIVAGERLVSLIVPFLFYFLVARITYNWLKSGAYTIKQLIQLAFRIILATVFLLSAVGKTLSFSAFQDTVSQYSNVPYLTHLILAFEYLTIPVLLIVAFKKYFGVALSAFLVLMTTAYAYGHFVLDVKECGCFGTFDLLNSDSFFIVLLKNLTLIAMVSYLVRVREKQLSLKLKVLSVCCVILLAFGVYKADRSYTKAFAFKNKEKSVRTLAAGLDNQVSGDFDYWFLFSPTCPHCKAAVPEVIKHAEKESLSVLGVTFEGNSEALTQLVEEHDIQFQIIELPKAEFKKLTKTVPIIFEMESDIIKEVYRVKHLNNIKK